MKMSGVIRLSGVLAAALAVVGMIAAVMACSKWEERVGGAKKVRVIREAEITVDGNFGAQTRRAVIAIQSQLGVEQNGAIGPVEWVEIITRGNDL